MIPWIQPAKRKRQMNRLGGRTPVQQQVQRPSPTPRQGSGGSIPMGGSSTTTGPAQQQQQQQQANSPLGGLLAMKETYDQTNDAYKGGQNIAKKAGEYGGRLSESVQNGASGLQDFLTRSVSPTVAGTADLARAATQNAIGSTASNFGLGGSVPQVSLNSGIIEGLPGATGATQQTANNIVQEAYGGLTKDALSGGSKAGVDALGVAGAGLGVGLGINDMVQNGVSFGNVTGVLGSGILGASALSIGAANAWNPVGWALLGASAVDSIFDIF